MNSSVSRESRGSFVKDAYWLNLPLGEVRLLSSSSVEAAPIKLTAKLRVMKPPLKALGTTCPWYSANKSSVVAGILTAT